MCVATRRICGARQERLPDVDPTHSRDLAVPCVAGASALSDVIIPAHQDKWSLQYWEVITQTMEHLQQAHSRTLPELHGYLQSFGDEARQHDQPWTPHEILEALLSICPVAPCINEKKSA